MADLPSLRVFLKANTSEFQRGMRSAARSLNKFEQNVGKAARSANIAMAAMGTAAAGIAIRGVKLAATWEQTTVAFETMLGSGERAKRLLDELTAFSTKTPFEPDEVIMASKTLISFGFQAEKVAGILRMLGDVSSGTGKDLNELSRLFGKVFVKGKAQAEELNQFVEAGIPIFEKLAEVLKADQKAIFDMASKGKVDFEAIREAFEKMTGEGGRFFEMMEKQSQTAIGQWSTLKGNIDLLTRSIGEKLLPIVNTALGKLNRLFSLGGAGEDVVPEWLVKLGVSTPEDYKREIRLSQSGLRAAGFTEKEIFAMGNEQVVKLAHEIGRRRDVEEEKRGGGFLPLADAVREVMPDIVKQMGERPGFSPFDFLRERATQFMTQAFGSMMNMEQVSTFSPLRLARAAQAGSQEAYGLRVSGREIEEKKLVKKNTDANITTATLIERLATEGVALKNIAIAAAF